MKRLYHKDIECFPIHWMKSLSDLQQSFNVAFL